MEENVFDLDQLRAILNVGLDSSRTRGKTQFSLLDLIDIAKNGARHGNATVFIEDVIPRERHRWDIKLKETWVERMAAKNDVVRKALEMIERLRKTVSVCKHSKVSWHMMCISPGSPDQKPHRDAPNHCYYTFIIPLTSHVDSGGTHFPFLNKTVSPYGGILCFDGTLEHLGMGNRSKKDRIFLYAAVYSGKDAN